jgi:hypothetical protein
MLNPTNVIGVVKSGNASQDVYRDGRKPPRAPRIVEGDSVGKFATTR